VRQHPPVNAIQQIFDRLDYSGSDCVQVHDVSLTDAVVEEGFDLERLKASLAFATLALIPRMRIS
jgi:hypothetical protein